MEGASMFSGGVFNMVFSGTGRLVVSAYGTLQTRLVRTAGAGALVGRGSGGGGLFS